MCKRQLTKEDFNLQVIVIFAFYKVMFPDSYE